MRVIVTIQHPAHVHFFKHAIAELEADGHDVFVFARENEVVSELLDRYEIDHEILAGESNSLLSLAAVQATYEARLLARARRIKPDVITAIGGPAATHVAKLVGAKSVVFYDTEHATLIKMLAYPFADTVCTPECYDGDVGSKKIEYPGYHELAYLHPDRFEPDPSVLEAAGLEPDDTFVVMRLSSWDSSHDMGQGGFDDPIEAVRRLEDAGATVLITSEVPLPEALESNRTTTSPEQMHHLLAYADCFVGEGATMAAEAAVLGTPAVYVNSLSLGYMRELEEEYGLVFNFNGDDRHVRSLEKAVSIIEAGDDGTWNRRRERLLADRIDVTDVIVRELETVAGIDPDRSALAANAD
ncbi:DUF354 domain-containing protein [Natronococcus jeotgali]|uniref:DUF354 domain-containing protein n=1 Tax=Natronococcus jeotgali DSM 18795 TaxID=1227498 RepID=L9XT94_9EURY|nr:DUF354 domain-containing protein [Natronococcus jeotgali]ELY64782.1 hypothetical protein C492_04600 [Natronococcus jeotgali DSM 18795]